MPEQDDLQIAFHALQQGDITRPQLLDALYGMAEDKAAGLPGRALGAILVQKRYLPQQRLREIITANAMPGMIPEEATRGDAIKLGELLAMSGVVTYAQVMEALLQQEIGREQGQPRMRLGEYLVSMGYTTPQAIQRALAYQRKAVFSCKKCRARFNIVNAQTNQIYQCVRCQGQLVPETEDVRVDESTVVEAMQESAAPLPLQPASEDGDSFPMERVQADRSVMQHLRKHRLVSDKSLHDAEQWQLEIAQFGLHAPILEILRRLKALPEDVARRVKPEDFPTPGNLKYAIPGYQVIGRVTSGQSSSVYSAQPLHTPGPIGIKILHADLSENEEQIARFKQDASLLIRFDHPGLAKGYQYGSAPLPGGWCLHYLTTEYMRGQALDHLLDVKGKLPPARAVTLTLHLAHALRYLEREGFVVPEVRPEHVLVDERHRARLIEIGSAAAMEAGGGATVLAASVFSVGRLLRAMLTGTYAEGETLNLDLGSVCLSASLVGVIRRMLDPDAARRFAHFAEVVAALQATSEPAA